LPPNGDIFETILAAIESRVRLATQPAPEARRGRTSAPIALYRLGLISAARLRGELSFQGAESVELARLVQSALLDRERVVRDALRDQLLRSYERGDIEEPILILRLRQIGIPPEHIPDEVLIAKYRRAAAKGELPPDPTT